MTRFEFQVEENFAKTRLEDYLCEKFPNLSKMYLRELVKDGKCEVNGIAENRGLRLRCGDFVEIEADISRETAMKPEAIPLEIVFEDEEIIVVNKPTGMLAHPTHRDKNGTLLNALSYHLNYSKADRELRIAELETKSQEPKNEHQNAKSAFRNPQSKIVRPGLIHRLDKQTSGLMVVAKQARAHRILCSHFQKKRVEKKYLALVEGVVKENSGTIVAPIGRFAEIKYWNIKADGKHSETRFCVKKRFSDSTLLELEPVTGRTNQLRIHCAHIGHPIVGDTRRGGREFPRLCLHAYKLSFWHPNGNERLEFESKITDKKIFDL
jgi:23S rRNA pseudouridine1911/1915/1917 synthase